MRLPQRTTLRQADLIGTVRGPAAPLPPETSEPDTVRVRLYALLGMARAAREMPWEPPREDERDALRHAFAEPNRLRHT